MPQKPQLEPRYLRIALIVAAGSGSRLGGELPKPYQEIGEISLLRHVLEVFCNHPQIDAVQVVYRLEDQDLYDKATKGLDLLPPIQGGKERANSVYAGLKAIEPYAPDFVLIHDAARPFIKTELIDRILESLTQHPAVIPIEPVYDTLKLCDEQGHIVQTMNRAHIKRAQTPQGFYYPELLNAYYLHGSEEMTDEASLYETLEKPVFTVKGDASNFKITTADDIKLAQAYYYIEQQGDHYMSSSHSYTEYRTGSGFDVHGFVAPITATGNVIMLCGVKVPHSKSLLGHSDADVGLHAITDALLGAIGKGDIGEYFPPSNPAYKNADSAMFVKKACELVEEAGGKVTSLDVTFICEEPKLSEYKLAMRQQVASLLQIEVQRVNIKATTTEGLGFTGRKEGIAAQAVATIGFR